MKVNVYDEENIQKGKLMLLNIAEDLKEYAKVIVSPTQDQPKSKEAAAGSKGKPSSLEDIEKIADLSKNRKESLVQMDEEADSDDSDLESRPQYLYMELESTVSFADIDIDKMMENTSMDDFMRGLYMDATFGPSSGTATKKGQPLTETQKMFAFLSGGQTDLLGDEAADTALSGPQLVFDDKSEGPDLTDEALTKKAIENLKAHRLKLKQSEIFSQQRQQARPHDDSGSDLEEGSIGGKTIDLTQDQLNALEME